MAIRLEYIALELTDRCNLDCIYCYNVWKLPDVVRKPFGSYKQATKTLRELFRQADIGNVTLTGGEPFISERLTEVALMCRMEGKTVTMISNGYAGTPEHYKSLIGMGVTLFELPIHSNDEAVHDAITGVKGSWQRSLASIAELQRLGAYVVPVIVLTKYNAEGLGRTLEYIGSLGLRRIMLNRYNIGGRHAHDPRAVSATHLALRSAFKVANEKAAQLGLTISSNVCTPICLLDPADYPNIAFGHCSTSPLQKPVTIDIDGNVRLCNHSPVVAGNIFEKPLEQILYSPYALSWGEMKPDYCASCDKWERCLGGCRAASEQCGQGLGAVDPIMTAMQ